jgi:PAS domain S-box-containing protein
MSKNPRWLTWISPVIRLSFPSGLKYTLALLLAALWALGLPGYASSSPAPLEVTDAPFGVVDLTPYTTFLVDPSAKLEIGQVASEPWSLKFIGTHAKIPSFGFTRAAVWLRFEVRSTSSEPKSLMIELATSRLSHFTWYVLEGGMVKRILANGAADSHAGAENDSRFPFLEVTIPPGESRMVYARAESNTAIWLPLRAGSPMALQRFNEQRLTLDILHIGFCSATAFFSLLMALAQRQRLYFYLTFFALAYAIYYTIFQGYGRAAWPAMPFWIERQGFLIFAVLGAFSFTKFNSAYLGFEAMSPWERFTQRSAELLLLLPVFFYLTLEFFVAVQLMTPILVIGLLAGSIVIASRLRRIWRYEDAWFLLAWGALGFSNITFGLQSMDVIPVIIPFRLLQQLMFPSVLVAFFLAVAARQRGLQDEEKRRDALRIAEKRAFELTENIPAGTYTLELFPDETTSVRFEFRHFSTRFLEIFGVSRDAVQKDPLTVLGSIHPDDQESMRESNFQALVTRKPFRWQGRLVVDGNIRWAFIASNPRPSAEGTIVWEGIVTDITARILAEQNLEQALVTEQRLRREADILRCRAEQADKEKSKFLANMSHEVRTPLSALVSLSQAMWLECEKHALPAGFERLLNRVRSGGKYLNLVLTNLLDVSAAESGRTPLHPQSFYVANWVDDIRNILEPIADSHEARLEWNLPEDDNEKFTTDPMRLTQILLNLAHNAIKFGGEGKAVVRIGAELRDEALHLNIEDNGPGIQSPRLEELFQAYEQGKTQSSSYERGVGLGLAVVKLNLGLLRGKITASNAEPHGLKFHVEIPPSIPSEDKKPTAPTP